MVGGTAAGGRGGYEGLDRDPFFGPPLEPASRFMTQAKATDLPSCLTNVHDSS